MAQKRSFARVVSEWSLVFAGLAWLPSIAWTTQRQVVPIGAHGGMQGSPETGACSLVLVGIALLLALVGVCAAPRRSNWVVVWTLIVAIIALQLALETDQVLYA